jgi:hypothetical protein
MIDPAHASHRQFGSRDLNLKPVDGCPDCAAELEGQTDVLVDEVELYLRAVS